MGWKRVQRTVNGFVILEDKDDFGEWDRDDDFEETYKISKRAKATQTEVNVNDKTLLGEINRMAEEVSSLQEILKGQERRLTQWEIFRETVVKRMTGVMEESQATQATKEAEIGRIVDLLVSAMHQNEELANKLSAIATAPPADRRDGSMSAADVAKERKKIAGTFTALLTRARKQRYAMEQRCEALEKSALTANEAWGKRLEQAQRDLASLHRGFIDGAVRDGLEACNRDVAELTLAGHGGMPLVTALERMDKDLPAPMRRDLGTAVEQAFTKLDAASVLAAKTTMDVVTHGHKQVIVGAHVRKAAQIIRTTRDVTSELVKSMSVAFGEALKLAEVRLNQQEVELRVKFDEEIRAVRDELAAEQKAGQISRAMATRNATANKKKDFGVQVYESVLTTAMSEANLTATLSMSSKTGSSAKLAAGKAKPKPKRFADAKLPTADAQELLELGTDFVNDLVLEAKSIAGASGAAVPTRVEEAQYINNVLLSFFRLATGQRKEISQLQASMLQQQQQQEQSFALSPTTHSLIGTPPLTPTSADSPPSLPVDSRDVSPTNQRQEVDKKKGANGGRVAKQLLTRGNLRECSRAASSQRNVKNRRATRVSRQCRR
jgi:hypothetical protein